MKKIIAAAIILCICVSVCTVLFFNFNGGSSKLPEKSHTQIEKGKFGYDSLILDSRAEYLFSYSDKWFERSAQQYNCDIARISVRAAIAAAETQPDNIKQLLEDIGFDKKSTCIEFPKPERDTIGYIIGHKYIEGLPLVVCVVRGGGYDSEWADNFNIGTNGNHQGFEAQAKKVNAAVNKYIEENKIDNEKLKIWITGFSRGAITSNMAAHELSHKYGNDDVFAYCFECPQGVSLSNIKSVDKNIFNIVNDIDFITYLAPEGWDFGRYGITCYIPSEYSSADYESLKEKMSDNYGKIHHAAKNMPETKSPQPYISPERPGQARLIGSVFNSISKTMTRKEAEEKLFKDVRDTIESYYADGKIKVPVKKLVIDCVAKIIKSIGVEAAVLFVQSGMKFDEFTGAVADTIDSHYPELCMAWVDTVDTLIKEDESTYLMTVK